MPNDNELNLSEMAQGAFMERFHIELYKVLANIKDPNTDPKKARKITLTATLKPNEKRELATFEVQSKSDLAPAKPLSTMILIDKDADGKAVGKELKSGQKGQTFVDADGKVKDDTGKVIEMKNQSKTTRG